MATVESTQEKTGLGKYFVVTWGRRHNSTRDNALLPRHECYSGRTGLLTCLLPTSLGAVPQVVVRTNLVAASGHRLVPPQVTYPQRLAELLVIDRSPDPSGRLRRAVLRDPLPCRGNNGLRFCTAGVSGPECLEIHVILCHFRVSRRLLRPSPGTFVRSRFGYQGPPGQSSSRSAKGRRGRSHILLRHR